MSTLGYVLLGILLIVLAAINHYRGEHRRKLYTIKLLKMTYRGISEDLKKLNELVNDELSPLEIYWKLIGTVDTPPLLATFLNYTEHFAAWTVTNEFEAHAALVEMRTELERLQEEAFAELLSAIDAYGPYVAPSTPPLLIKKNG